MRVWGYLDGAGALVAAPALLSSSLASSRMRERDGRGGRQRAVAAFYRERVSLFVLSLSLFLN